MKKRKILGTAVLGVAFAAAAAGNASATVVPEDGLPSVPVDQVTEPVTEVTDAGTQVSSVGDTTPADELLGGLDPKQVAGLTNGLNV